MKDDKNCISRSLPAFSTQSSNDRETTFSANEKKIKGEKKNYFWFRIKRSGWLHLHRMRHYNGWSDKDIAKERRQRKNGKKLIKSESSSWMNQCRNKKRNFRFVFLLHRLHHLFPFIESAFVICRFPWFFILKDFHFPSFNILYFVRLFGHHPPSTSYQVCPYKCFKAHKIRLKKVDWNFIVYVGNSVPFWRVLYLRAPLNKVQLSISLTTFYFLLNRLRVFVILCYTLALSKMSKKKKTVVEIIENNIRL